MYECECVCVRVYSNRYKWQWAVPAKIQFQWWLWLLCLGMVLDFETENTAKISLPSDKISWHVQFKLLSLKMAIRKYKKPPWHSVPY